MVLLSCQPTGATIQEDNNHRSSEIRLDGCLIRTNLVKQVLLFDNANECVEDESKLVLQSGRSRKQNEYKSLSY